VLSDRCFSYFEVIFPVSQDCAASFLEVKRSL
jgi:hypothetical protein